MKKYVIIDLQNCMMRSKHSAHQGADVWTRIGLALHITLSSIKKVFEEHKADHVVFCAEGRSWRKDIDTKYKRNRDQTVKKMSPQDQEELQIFFGMVNEFTAFIKEKTNSTLLQNSICEADDLIARWIQTHPEDHHIIVSTDKDFHQLLSDNVEQFDPIYSFLYTIYGVYDDKGNPAHSNAGKPIETPDPEFSLFVKCIRGDTSDNVFSAYPGVRMKSTKKKIGITEAYNDRKTQGYPWNNFMNQRWTHHDGSEKVVKEQYHKNKLLVDLTMQPDVIKESMDETIKEAKEQQPKQYIGLEFIKLCNKYELENISSNPQPYVEFFKKGL